MPCDRGRRNPRSGRLDVERAISGHGNEHWFPTLLHARTEIERWRREYNQHRPKKAIGAMTPAAYAQQLANSDIINPGL